MLSSRNQERHKRKDAAEKPAQNQVSPASVSVELCHEGQRYRCCKDPDCNCSVTTAPKDSTRKQEVENQCPNWVLVLGGQVQIPSTTWELSGAASQARFHSLCQPVSAAATC